MISDMAFIHPQAHVEGATVGARTNDVGQRFDTDDRNFLASRGVVFCTSFKAGGRTYGGNIIAPSMAHAEEIAFGRGLNEEIVGVMVETGIDP